MRKSISITNLSASHTKRGAVRLAASGVVLNAYTYTTWTAIGTIETHAERLVGKVCGNDLKKRDKLFHDLRRKAIRNIVRAGVSDKVAMLIPGHKTRPAFDRYDIVNERELENAAERIDHFIVKPQRRLSV